MKSNILIFLLSTLSIASSLAQKEELKFGLINKSKTTSLEFYPMLGLLVSGYPIKVSVAPNLTFKPSYSIARKLFLGTHLQYTTSTNNILPNYNILQFGPFIKYYFLSKKSSLFAEIGTNCSNYRVNKMNEYKQKLSGYYNLSFGYSFNLINGLNGNIGYSFRPNYNKNYKSFSDLSIGFNYFLNKKYIFKSDKKRKNNIKSKSNKAKYSVGFSIGYLPFPKIDYGIKYSETFIRIAAGRSLTNNISARLENIFIIGSPENRKVNYFQTSGLIINLHTKKVRKVNLSMNSGFQYSNHRIVKTGLPQKQYVLYLPIGFSIDYKVKNNIFIDATLMTSYSLNGHKNYAESDSYYGIGLKYHINLDKKQ